MELPQGIPSHDTFAWVLARLKPDELQRCFLNWMCVVCKLMQGEVVAIDGKMLRRSFDWATGKGSIHMVGAGAAANRLISGQRKVEGKSNEIKAIPALPEQLDLEGFLVTIEATGCQKEVARTIVEQRADYVLALLLGRTSTSLPRFLIASIARSMGTTDAWRSDGTSWCQRLDGQRRLRHGWACAALTWWKHTARWVRTRPSSGVII